MKQNSKNWRHEIRIPTRIWIIFIVSGFRGVLNLLLKFERELTSRCREIAADRYTYIPTRLPSLERWYNYTVVDLEIRSYSLLKVQMHTHIIILNAYAYITLIIIHGWPHNKIGIVTDCHADKPYTAKFTSYYDCSTS